MEIRLPLILDGATGTELQKRGFKGEQSAEEWTINHPEAILEIQRAYVQAGSNVVYSPTFGANRIKLEEHGLFGKVEEYNKRLVALSKEAVGNQAYVAGDLAPTGKFLYPLGDIGFEELVEVYTEQARALKDAGVSLFVVETMMSISDARAAVLGIRSVSDKPIMVSFTCDESGKTMTGTDVAAALLIMQGMGVQAFGLNCSTGPEEMLKQIRRLKAYARIPLLVKPNAGLPEIVEGKTVYQCTPEEFITYTEEFAKEGCGVFGGCCGTTPEHIKALKGALGGVECKAPNPENSELLPAATEKQPFLLPIDARYGEVLTCGDDLEDDLLAALDEPEALLAIRIETLEEAELFAEVQYMITKPLCLLCEDSRVLEKALRFYQGRALYEGMLSQEELEPLVNRYGLLI